MVRMLNASYIYSSTGREMLPPTLSESVFRLHCAKENSNHLNGSSKPLTLLLWMHSQTLAASRSGAQSASGLTSCAALQNNDATVSIVITQTSMPPYTTFWQTGNILALPLCPLINSESPPASHAHWWQQASRGEMATGCAANRCGCCAAGVRLGDAHKRCSHA